MDIKKIVKKKYSEIAESGCGCCSGDSKCLGYSNEDMNLVPEANLGLGCGNPTVFAQIKKGDTLLDLGSGAGFDAFIASRYVGEKGKVIGVDMTESMVKKAQKNAEKYSNNNMEFRLGDIEDFPIKNESVDVVISNCVINLAPDKEKVFREAYRVLKKGGKLCVSDILLLEELSEEQRNDEDLIAGCVGIAILKEDYIALIKKVGFKIKKTDEDKQISKQQYGGLPLESLKILAVK